jgi:hypothetical protein
MYSISPPAGTNDDVRWCSPKRASGILPKKSLSPKIGKNYSLLARHLKHFVSYYLFIYLFIYFNLAR